MGARASRVLGLLVAAVLLGAVEGCRQEVRPAPTSTAATTVVVPTPLPSATPTLTARPTVTASPTPPAVPSSTPIPTFAPFPTVTPPPMRPTKPPLVVAGWGPGDGGFVWYNRPGILRDYYLYPDGQAISVKSEIEGGREFSRIYETAVETDEICGLLQELDDLGFFDFPTNNKELYAFDETTVYSEGGPKYDVWVSGPRFHAVGFYYSYIPYLRPVGAAILEAFRRFQPAATQLYVPEELLLYIRVADVTEAEATAEPWPAELPPISELWLDRTTDTVLVTGPSVAPLLEYYDFGVQELVWMEQGVNYVIGARPLLPHESRYRSDDVYYDSRVEDLPFTCPSMAWLTATPIVPTVTRRPTITPNPAVQPLVAEGRMLYTSSRDGNNEIYVANVDGSNEAQLTNHPAVDRSPAWSPDGSHVSFSSNRDGNFEIYTMNADGTDVTRLTYDAADDDQPAWSPDGRRLAFVSDRIPPSNRYEINNYNLFVMNADGTQLLRMTERGGKVLWPAWSPDGMTIAFTRDARSFDHKLYLISREGVGERYLADGGMPAWSPDGQQIAVACEINVCVVDLESGETTTLTDLVRPAPYSSWTAHPDWSGDGRYIIFESVAGGISGARIYAVAVADGSLFWLNLRALEYPDWWP